MLQRITQRTAFLLSLVLLCALPVGAQIEEEDLAAPDLNQALWTDPGTGVEELQTLFAETEDLFHWQGPESTLDTFSRIVALLEGRAEQEGIDEIDAASRSLLLRSLAYRARARYLTDARGEGERDQPVDPLVVQDLDRILEIEPGASLPGDSELIEVFDLLRERSIAELEIVSLTPADASLRINGRPMRLPRPETPAAEDPGAEGEAEEAEASEPEPMRIAIPAGTLELTFERPGFHPQSLLVEIAAQKTEKVEIELERSHALIRLRTLPVGARVVIDGEGRGVTEAGIAEGEAGEETAEDAFLTSGTTARYAAEDFSAELLIEPVEPGLRVLEVRKEGYRPYRAELYIDEALDYPMPPIVLEEERSILVLRDFPEGAQLLVDGRPTEFDPLLPQLTLPPGPHSIRISSGPTRMFDASFELADRQTMEIGVRLKPGLAYLGVMGETEEARQLDLALQRVLGDLDRWALLDHRERREEMLRVAGIDRSALRRAAAGGAAPDWQALQRAADRATPGLLYVLPVTDDDLLPTRVDLWILAAAPGPARPALWSMPLSNSAQQQRLAELLQSPLRLYRSWLGGVLVDSPSDSLPLLFDVVPGGPLDTAGARAGERLRRFADVPVRTVADVENRLKVLEPGESFEIELESGATRRGVWVRLGTSPQILQPGPDLLDPVLFTELVLLDERAREEDRWLLRFNQAMVLLRAGDRQGAIRRLRDLKAPGSVGLGRATADYWLGVALSHSGPDYRAAAVEALERAAGAAGARLDHHDGPWLAPRARARLRDLRGTP